MARDSGASGLESEEPTSLDQLPVRWDDRRLLQHEPLRSLFACREQSSLRTDYPNSHWAGLIKASIINKEFVRAYIRWCLLAFQPWYGEQDPRLPKPSDFAEKSSFWEIFVEIFSVLHLAQSLLDKATVQGDWNEEKARRLQEKKEQALRLLENERRRLGFQDYLIKRGVQYPRNPPLPLERISGSTSSHDTALAVFDEEAEGRAGNLSYHVDAACRLFILYSKDIDAATDRFMKTIPKDAIGLAISMSGRLKRKVAPPPQQLTYLSRMDEAEKRASSKQTKRKRQSKSKDKVPAKGKTRGPIKTNSSVVIAQGCSEVVHETVQIAPEAGVSSGTVVDQMVFSSESIVVDNRPASLSLSSAVGANANPSDVSQRQGKVRNTKKRRPEATERAAALSAPPRHESSERKQKVSSSKGKRESALTSSRQTENPPNDDGATFNKRRKKASKSRPILDGEVPISERKRCLEHPLSNGLANGTHIIYSVFDSSDDTLVNGNGNENAICSKVQSLRDITPNDSTIKFVRPAAVEDPIRRKKLLESLDQSRPQVFSPKPPLPEWARPLVWAGSRQALCETTTWFRCYHGGVYFSNGKVHGYLLGGHSAQRDKYCHDGKLIISHGGGKSLGGSGSQRDDDNSVRALLYNYRERHPLVLLIDDKYAPFPFGLEGKMYVVLGLYWIVNAWAEVDISETNGKVEARVKYKFAFQYCEEQGSPWWYRSIPNGLGGVVGGPHCTLNSPGTPYNLDEAPRSVKTFYDAGTLEANPYPKVCPREKIYSANEQESDPDCALCHKKSPWIYKQGWMCLNPDCSKFFYIGSEEVFTLEYREEFLELRHAQGFGKIDLSLSSPLPNPEQSSADSFYSTVGLWCSDCGQLCPRERWESWECPRCNKSYPPNIPFLIRHIKDFFGQESDLKDYKVYRVYEGSGITVSFQRWFRSKSEKGMHYVFILPEKRGQIHLIRGNTYVNGRANELFRQYQEDALKRKFLRRYPLRFHHARGQMLTNYFSHNGKSILNMKKIRIYIVDPLQAGVPYKYAVTTNITDPFDRAPQCVNRALQLIKDRASLVTQKEADFNEILTAAYMERQKMSYHTDDEKGLGPVVASLSLGSIAHMHFRHRRTATNRSIEKQLSIVLRHGDVLVMEGAPIQELYEHSVVPLDFRIAATARCIDQEPKKTDMIPVPTMEKRSITYPAYYHP